MDSFNEPYTRAGDDISVAEVRAQVAKLEEQHRANGIELSGRIIHVCHSLPVIAALNTRAGVLSPPATPPNKVSEVPASPTGVDAPDLTEPAPKDSAVWTLTPRYGHSAMISGIRSLSATHDQIIVGWTGDIVSPTHTDKVSPASVSEADRAALDEALTTYTPKESDPDDDKKTTYVPVWMDDQVAHGHYDGYCKQSASLSIALTFFLTNSSSLATFPLSPLAGRRHRIRFRRLPLSLLRICERCFRA